MNIRYKRRVIDTLRANIPGKWIYLPGDVAPYLHEPTGRRVCVCAQLSPKFDGDDDSFETQVRWFDTMELLWTGSLFSLHKLLVRRKNP